MDLVFIVPVFGQGPLIAEALGSILAQRTTFQTAVILVDDACPEPETRTICQRFARAHPERIFYWRSAGNRGLAAMRNAGIDFALARWPDLFGLVSFDGDDRLHPAFVERAVNALRGALAAPKPEGHRIGWVFEDPDHFEQDGLMLRTHRYSALWSLAGCANCPTSICDADMFRDGLRFREDLRHGSEDWDFWLACLAAGYRGHFVPHIGFRYRRRAGSMSAGAFRDAEANKVALRRRHKSLYHPDFFLAEEAKELPRYLWCDDRLRPAIRPAADSDGAATSFAAYGARLADYSHLPTAEVPQYAMVISEPAERILADNGLLPWAAWQAERLAGKDKIGWLKLTTPAEENTLDLGRPGLPSEGPEADLYCVPSSLLIQLAKSGGGKDWLLRSQKMNGRVIGCGAAPAYSAAATFKHFLSAIGETARGFQRSDPQRFTSWKPFGLHYSDLSHAFFEIAHLMPGRKLNQEVLVIADGALARQEPMLSDLLTLSSQLEERHGTRPSLLCVGSVAPLTLASAYKRILLADKDPLEKAKPDDALLALIAPFGEVYCYGFAHAVAELNQTRRFGRKVHCILPPFGTPNESEMISCFKVFDTVEVNKKRAGAQVEALGVSKASVNILDHTP